MFLSTSIAFLRRTSFSEDRKTSRTTTSKLTKTTTNVAVSIKPPLWFAKKLWQRRFSPPPILPRNVWNVQNETV